MPDVIFAKVFGTKQCKKDYFGTIEKEQGIKLDNSN